MKASTFFLIGIGGAAGVLYLDGVSTKNGKIASIEVLLNGKHYNKAVDLGCGSGDMGRIIRKYADYVIGIDSDANKLELASERNTYDRLVISDAKDFVPDSDTDLVVLIDIIEHMTKEDGMALLDRLSSVKSVVITTPSKFYEDNLSLGDELQKHRSLWTEQEFAERGFAASKVAMGWLSSYFYDYTIIAYKS